HALSLVPPLLLQREFGKPGKQLWEKARGIDHRPVIPYTERQSISTECTFQNDTTNVEFLRTTLNQMVAQLAFELRQSGRLTSCITVKLRYTDFNTFTRQQRLSYTASDTALLQHARALLEKLYERRQLVRLLGVRFSQLVPGHPQMSLFEASAEEQRLQAAMDGIRKRFGKGAVGRGTNKHE
ncbi:MAG: DNA polymerase IV, partial [Phaeodactylibacter sp.]|nr:DNA polymerase IV [Phaeodactylibacter sp.]